MFIIQLTYKVAIEKVDKYLSAHREFLDDCYRKGLLIASGPMEPRTGGILIATTKDKQALENTLQQDPFYLAEIADYKLIQFVPNKLCEELKPRIQKTEGPLC